VAADYYLVLDLPRAGTASALEVTAAYRKKAKATHPDIHPDNPGAEAAFKEAAAAYAVLHDDTRRAAYDCSRRLAGAAGPMPEDRWPRAFGFWTALWMLNPWGAFFVHGGDTRL
jgi:DnaJ-class molecular chaperone